MDGCPLGLGLVVEDKPTEFSCTIGDTKNSTHTLIHSLTHSRFSPDGKLLAVGSDDACVDIYCTSDPSQNGLPRCGYCRGIPSAVTSLDWSHDSHHVQVEAIHS